MDGHDIEWVKGTYKDRYMPALWEMEKRFCKMHKDDFDNPKSLAKEMHQNLEELEASVEEDILENESVKEEEVIKSFQETENDNWGDDWDSVINHADEMSPKEAMMQMQKMYQQLSKMMKQMEKNI